MANTIGQLELGRAVYKEVFLVESATQTDWVSSLIGNEINTTQAFERFKSLIGLGAATRIDEGDTVSIDSYAPLFTADFTPFMVAKGLQWGLQADFTNQYKTVIPAMPQIAKSFTLARSKYAAGLFNNGFTDTTSGMNSEVLFSTSHSNGSATSGSSNRPSTDIAMGPTAIAQMYKEIRNQRSPRNEAIEFDGEVRVLCPVDLEATAFVLGGTKNVPWSNNNDKNFAATKFSYTPCVYLTSSTAWFARAENNNAHRLFFLKQMPFNCEMLPLNLGLQKTWVGYESYIPGWADWHGTWGTTGA